MEGFFVQHAVEQKAEIERENTTLQLLMRNGETEIMLQTVQPHSIMWIEPGEDPDLSEFFYLLQGDLQADLPEGTVRLSAGDSFYAQGLRQEVRLQNDGLVQMLYITSKQLFDELYSFRGDLNHLLQQVDEKDKYTYGHGKRVMDYSLKISRRLQRSEQSIELMTVAALFHDVGKYFVPNEVLNKPGRLTEEEFRFIRRHPTDSRRLLEPRFGPEIARIAQCHHEKLDGSGYPNRIQGDEIPFEARVIAVADTFDAMTSQRPYKGPKTAAQAVAELRTLLHQYDAAAVEALAALVESGEIRV